MTATARDENRTARLRLSAGLAAVALFTVGSIGMLLQSTDSQSSTAVHAADLDTQVSELSLLEWRLVARGAVTAEQRAEFTRRADAIVVQADAVAQGPIPEEQRSAVTGLAREHVAAAKAHVGTLHASTPSDAAGIDRASSDERYTELRATAQTIARERKAIVSRAKAWSHGSMTAVILVAFLAVVTLLHRDSRRRAAAAVQDAAAASAAHFAALFRNASDIVVVTDRSGHIQYASPSLSRTLGVTGEAATDSAVIRKLMREEDADATWDAFRAIAEVPGAEGTLEWRMTRADGSHCVIDARLANLLDDVDVQGVVWTCRDVTDRRALEQELSRQAFHDGLTGLPNRALLRDRLDHALRRAGRDQSSSALLVLDLDGFKEVNDRAGHAAGDLLLTVMGHRLQAMTRPHDTCARLGGDEFALLLDGVDLDHAVVIAERLLAHLTSPAELADGEVRVTASIGIAMAYGGDDVDALHRNADLAMYRAKRNGKNAVVAFRPEMATEAFERLSVARELDGAVDRGEMVVHYQPIVDLDDAKVLGLEALVRWEHPENGLVPPNVFIPVAEETRAILDIGRFVLREACRHTARWQREHGMADLMISVNLSGRQLADAGLLDDVRGALEASGLDPALLQLEITETALIADLASAGAALEGIRRLGVRIAIDDFGSGYSALSYLRQLPIDVLKIDRAFVSDDSEHGAELLRGVVALSDALRMVTIAEGIEEGSQALRLLDAGCRRGQGFHYARPVAAEAVSALLAGGVDVLSAAG